MRLLIEKAKAKINLTLDVKYKRSDGYHEVEMIMQTVDLYDRLVFQERERDEIVLTCNMPYIPLDDRNLVYRAAELIKREFAIHKGIHVHIEKKIPVAAGLAGGSSDAAATLRGLNQLWQLGATYEELENVGASIGSDVPFCIRGGTAVARGRGEILEHLPIQPNFWVILAKLPISVSTAEVYRKLNIQSIADHPSAIGMIHALKSGDIQQISGCLGNVLESVTFEMHPEVAVLKNQFLKFGAPGVLMSGSGPTVFAITDREAKAVRIYHAIRGYSRDVFLTRCW
ncbi:4-(cytidine 5'-diphospho)-2-C-methyl-D-erythritol kinase [Fodinisporobacter ferrooxydans]|uniref:4-diphosphocytidyl-2-C-methyl-D-erythritol kinase n=1 Tax=Fodinisporobacter ferrooxydans TaxID=2901836 RepID=A0ABY4CN25_9BACL|nr:4-(cytidine 5'-diphospho)-2-C-methyl-D-erythritol kinase [Alicyclobacillaceae bacterium MYW30-H2]